MAVSISKKKSKLLRKNELKELGFSDFIVAKFLHRIPLAILALIIIFLWSSSTTIISGSIVHVCVSSRKLNNLYCVSAGTQPNFEIPIPLVNGSDGESDVNRVSNGSAPTLKEISDGVREIQSEINVEQVSEFVPGIASAPIVKKNAGGNREKRAEVNVPGIGSAPIVKKNDGENKEKQSEVNVPGIGSAPIVQKYSGDGRNGESESNFIFDVVPGNGSAPIARDDRDEELKKALKELKDQLQIHRSWRSSGSKPPTCNGKGIYVYELPPKFNKDLISQCGDMIPWVDFCKYFTNGALGEPIQSIGKSWYNTHQYSLEPIFHSRVLNHPCRVYNHEEAKLFYVPFYGGLDILRWHFKNVTGEVKDRLSLELLQWLELQSPWIRNSGEDHVFVLGKISWDFRRYKDSSWGTRFLELDQMQSPVKLLIERHPWHINDVGIPHPTHFHPHSDDDIISWQSKVIQSNRKSLVSFAGAARPGAPENIRSILIHQCVSTATQNCRFLNCSSGGCDRPETLIDLFGDSEFCLQPPGDSPTRKSVFDSLISGCIPVMFDSFTAYYQYPWHLPEDPQKYSVFIDQEDVRNLTVNVVEKLMKIPATEREEMRRFIVYELLPGLVYGDSTAVFEKFEDAFSITMNNLLERVSKINLAKAKY